MVGGAYRGPVGVGRQRRAIRTVQVVLVAVAVALFLFAWGATGDDTGSSGPLDAPQGSSTAEVVVLGLLGLGALAAALALQTEGGVRLLTPAKLREMEDAGGQPIALEDQDEASG